MNTRIIFIENPAFLNIKDNHLQIENKLTDKKSIVPIEDIEIILLDNQRIALTNPLIKTCLANNILMIFCDEKHMPTGVTIPLEGNCLLNERLHVQISTTENLKGKIWKQIIISKIKNQASLLENLDLQYNNLLILSKQTKSKDSSNREAIAAAYYWKNIFKGKIANFTRDKDGVYPNNLLNYGYSLIRSSITKNIVSSGLHPSLGIFHKNKFNAFCLSDDLMEPFRPFVDMIVYNLVINNDKDFILSKYNKTELLKVLTLEVSYKGEITSLNNSIKNVVNDFVTMLSKEKNQIEFPKFKE